MPPNVTTLYLGLCIVIVKSQALLCRRVSASETETRQYEPIVVHLVESCSRGVGTKPLLQKDGMIADDQSVLMFARKHKKKIYQNGYGCKQCPDHLCRIVSAYMMKLGKTCNLFGMYHSRE